MGLGKKALMFLAVCLILETSCGGCDDSKLTDVSCKPGNPASGHYDPSLKEFCNGLDDNCNGVVDEGCDCRDGETRLCGSLAAAQICQVSPNSCPCRTGFQTCVNGQWAVCQGSVDSAPEVCDNIDNDCDGIVDNNIPEEDFWDGLSGVVFKEDTSSSICQRGRRLCRGGQMVVSASPVYPRVEKCNRLDDDCDGQPDNIREEPCGLDIGACRPGFNRCVEGDLICTDTAQTIHPRPEICNGIDDNCDGGADNNISPESCVNEQCQTTGLRYCRNGSFSACDARGPQSEELCGDGIDNNCDGQVDEGCVCAEGDPQLCRDNLIMETRTATGSVQRTIIHCGYGIKTCDALGHWGDCIFSSGTREICNNYDDDCNGLVDDDGTASYTLRRNCGSLITSTAPLFPPCQSGFQLCQPGGPNGARWGSCQGEILPQSEICDGVDNNCDGRIDEDINRRERVDMVFAIDISGSMCPYQMSLALGLRRYVSRFVNTEHRFCLELFPSINGGVIYGAQPCLTDAQSFLNLLSLVDCNGGGNEQSYDILLDLTSPTSTITIGWRPNADPLLIMVTDEPAQTYRFFPNYGNIIVKQRIANQAANCMLPGCRPGTRIDIFVITHPIFTDISNNNVLASDMYDTIVGQPDRIKNIEPATPDHYDAICREIFTEVCGGP